MRTTYRIKVKSLRGEAMFEYYAPTHPQESEVVYYRDKHYIVCLVGHVLKTTVDGNGESTTLDFIELEVTSGR